MKHEDITKKEFKIYGLIVFTKGNKQIFNYYIFDIKYNFIYASLCECLMNLINSFVTNSVIE